MVFGSEVVRANLKYLVEFPRDFFHKKSVVEKFLLWSQKFWLRESLVHDISEIYDLILLSKIFDYLKRFLNLKNAMNSSLDVVSQLPIIDWQFILVFDKTEIVPKESHVRSLRGTIFVYSVNEFLTINFGKPLIFSVRQ